jgi:putative hemolysin
MAEIQGLRPDQRLVASGPFLVFLAGAEDIPCLLKEIGRLREKTFRKEGEGSGRSLDLDPYDSHYRHLVLWNQKEQEVAGGYRMGLSEDILEQHGPSGFYTHTLFKYGAPFLSRITPAMELGRSFVREKYQKSYQPLMLLWKGIGRFVSMNPQYRNLFGPVSITRDYRSVSRYLMAAFLRGNSQVTALARLVRPRNPFKKKRRKQRALRPALHYLEDLQALSDLVSDIEMDHKGIPILIKQYLRLGGQVLGFNVDRQFSNVLDALILVDLMGTDPKILERYLGKEETRAFVDYHHARQGLAQVA